MIPVAAFGQLADRAHRSIGDGTIVAQDSQRVEFCLERDILGGTTSGVQDLHPRDWGSPQSLVGYRCLEQSGELIRERREPPPGRGVGDKRCPAFQQFDSVHCRRLRLVAHQLLDVLERVSIQPVRAEHALGESSQSLGALLVAQRRLLSRRGGDQNRMLHKPRIAREYDTNAILSLTHGGLREPSLPGPRGNGRWGRESEAEREQPGGGGTWRV